MPWFEFFWIPRTVEHLADHDVSQDEFEFVVRESEDLQKSRSSGDLAVIGWIFTGRRLFCVYRMIDELTVEPVTAYEI
jgi:hypothetical protein